MAKILHRPYYRLRMGVPNFARREDLVFWLFETTTFMMISVCVFHLLALFSLLLPFCPNQRFGVQRSFLHNQYTIELLHCPRNTNVTRSQNAPQKTTASWETKSWKTRNKGVGVFPGTVSTSSGTAGSKRV